MVNQELTIFGESWAPVHCQNWLWVAQELQRKSSQNQEKKLLYPTLISFLRKCTWNRRQNERTENAEMLIAPSERAGPYWTTNWNLQITLWLLLASEKNNNNNKGLIFMMDCKKLNNMTLYDALATHKTSLQK